MSRKSDLDNRSNQLNPNHPEFANCRNHRKRFQDDDYDDYDDTARESTSYRSPAPVPLQVEAKTRPEGAIDSIEFPPAKPEKLSADVAAIVAAFDKMKW